MQPERRIEKWLRAFAKKRREQAGEPMALRPATRQRLQREIARQSEKKSRGFFFNFYPRLRLVFAACFTALLIGGWFLWRESAGTPTRLSMNKASLPETPSGIAAPEAPPLVASPSLANADKKVQEEKLKTTPPAPQPAPPAVATANRALTKPPKEETRDRVASAATQKQSIVTTAAASTPNTNALFAYKNESAADSLSHAGAPTKDFAPVTAAPQGNSSLIAGAITSNANAQTALAFQRTLANPNSTNMALSDLAKTTGAITVSPVFNRSETPSTRRRADAPAGATATPAPVLSSFRVEQSGNNLKVVDGDGSVYTGSVQIAQQEPPADHTFAAAKNGLVSAARAAKPSAAPARQSYFFRVAGTNRNLNENVIFSGNFVPFTNNQLTAESRGFGGIGGGFGGGGGAGGDQAAGQPVQAVLSNSQINGNVVIGDQKAVDVVATPAR
jgi:hypothetical protein